MQRVRKDEVSLSKQKVFHVFISRDSSISRKSMSFTLKKRFITLGRVENANILLWLSSACTLEAAMSSSSPSLGTVRGIGWAAFDIESAKTSSRRRTTMVIASKGARTFSCFFSSLCFLLWRPWSLGIPFRIKHGGSRTRQYCRSIYCTLQRPQSKAGRVTCQTQLLNHQRRGPWAF